MPVRRKRNDWIDGVRDSPSGRCSWAAGLEVVVVGRTLPGQNDIVTTNTNMIFSVSSMVNRFFSCVLVLFHFRWFIISIYAKRSCHGESERCICP